jgi:UDP-N-acetylglucosamine--N-acetylmuramyl-(pentapeptide) pyrophosphoryl-undecaprenol N-acetylglucosamine transferase
VSTLLVASSGGHLKELHQLRDRVREVSGPFRWVTFDTPQSRSLLEGERVDFVPFVGGRDPVNVARNLGAAARVLRDRDIETVLSTGSAVALPYFALARLRRLRCHYVESAARIDGPSLTGRLVSRVPGVHLYAQYRAWAGGRWGYGGSVFDSFAGEDVPAGPSGRLDRVVVTLGTYRGYDFSRLVRRLLRILPAEAEVLWQTGDTDVYEFGIDGRQAIPEKELTAAMAAADAVIAHAGVGAALAAFEVGVCPVLVPRRRARDEHIDDHQTQIAAELGDRGLAISVEADRLSLGHLEAAAGREVGRRDDPPAFRTDG